MHITDSAIAEAVAEWGYAHDPYQIAQDLLGDRVPVSFEDEDRLVARIRKEQDRVAAE